MLTVRARRTWSTLVALGLSSALASAPARAGVPALKLADTGVVDAHVVGGIADPSSPRLSMAAIGDLNGDGIDDLAFGTPGADPNGILAAGSVYVLFGSSDDPGQRDVDLTLRDAFDVRIDGVTDGGQLGLKLAIADLNEDGIGDLIVAQPGSRSALFVKLGAKIWPRGVVTIDQRGSFDLAIRSRLDGQFVGAALCVDDLDRDGRADLVFAALGTDDDDRFVSTDLHVIPGRDTWPSKEYNLDDRIPGRIRLTRRVASRSRVVHSCALGDLDDDGVGDIVAGMGLDRVDEHEEAGTVAVVYDVLSRGGKAIDLGESGAPWGFRVKGDQGGARLGAEVAVGDFNGDGRDDLAIGSPRRLLVGPNSEGAVYLLWGGLLPSGSATLQPNLTLTGIGGGYGSVLAVADVNQDRREDLLIGAPSADTYTGARTGLVDVVLGGPQLTDAAQQRRYDHRIVGDAVDERLGHALAAGDLDGNGKVELVVRAASSPGGGAAGSLHLLAGVDTAASDVVASALRTRTYAGPGRGGRLTSGLLSADLDGDGQDDLAWTSPRGAGERGVVCVNLNATAGASQVTDLATGRGCDVRVLGPPGAHIASIDAGDFDGDGRLELALGMPDLAVGDDVLGVVAVLRWPETPTTEITVTAPAAKPTYGPGGTGWAWLGTARTRGLGAEVHFADLDGDRAAELMMASATASYDDRERAGALVVAMAKDTAVGVWQPEPGAGVRWRFEGGERGALGPGSRVLDFDGNGKADLLVVARGGSSALSRASGAAYLIYDAARLATGTFDVADPEVVAWTVLGPGEGAGLRAWGEPRDVDGDGIADLLLTAPFAHRRARRVGEGIVLLGRREQRRGYHNLEADGAADIIVQPRRGQQLTSATAADIDGDGRVELIVGCAPMSADDPGEVVVVRMSRGIEPAASGEVDLASGDRLELVVTGFEPGAELQVPPTLPDVDRDGRAELWIVSPQADGVATDQGKAYRVVVGR